MNPRDFWEGFFQSQPESEPREHPVEHALRKLALGHKSLYGGYLGPSHLSGSDSGFEWTFGNCDHGECEEVCAAHRGYIKGTLRAMGFSNVEVEREWQKPRCRLLVQRDRP